jgi:AAA15 family ATPase/GTPase
MKGSQIIKTIKIKGFRSVKEQVLELAPLTFLYGPNAAGKSSLFYALNVFKKIILNPNQSVDAFFNLDFINLGSFRQIVFGHKDEDAIAFSINVRKKVFLVIPLLLAKKKENFY